MLEWLGAGVLLLLACPGLYLLSRWYGRLALLTRARGVQSIEELRALHERVLAEVGQGAFVQHVAIEGTVVCDAPLCAELSGLQCAAFRYRVDRQWEETVRRREPNGAVTSRTVRGSERVAQLERRTTFWVTDGAGRIMVQADGARMELEAVVDRFDRALPGDDRRSLAERWRLLPQRPERRTLGYHLREEVLQVGQRVYVLGTATDRDGDLRLAGRDTPQEPFLVSVRSRDRVIAEALRLQVLTFYGACTCLPAGLACIAIALFLRRHGAMLDW